MAASRAVFPFALSPLALLPLALFIVLLVVLAVGLLGSARSRPRPRPIPDLPRPSREVLDLLARGEKRRALDSYRQQTGASRTEARNVVDLNAIDRDAPDRDLGA